MMFSRWVLTLVLSSALAACAVGPDFERPKLDLPAGWSRADNAAADSAALAEWWKSFTDRELDSLVERALTSNLDVAAATARVRQARAALTVARSPLFPEIDASADYTRSGPSGAAQSSSSSRNLYRAGFDASWEIDVFGGTRREIEAAHADLAAARERARDVTVTLIAEVGSRYFNVRALQQRVDIAEDNLSTQRENAAIAGKRYRAGFASKLDFANAEADAAATEAQIPLLEAALKQEQHALSLLLAGAPGTLYPELEEHKALPPAPPAIPVGLPSQLLERRPDVRAAEADLHAATARIGAAEAQLFPSFSLSAMIGLDGSTPSALGEWKNRVWNLSGGALLPVFDAGRRWAAMQGQRAAAEEAVAVYHAAVLGALRDVEDALVSYHSQADRRDALQRSAAASAEALALAKRLYTEGTAEFLQVLTAERSLFAAQDQLVQSDQSAAIAAIALYKALGGGWQS